MKSTSLRVLAAVLAGAVLLASCSKSGGSVSSDSIKIGEFASLTGKEAAFGQSSHKGTSWPSTN